MILDCLSGLVGLAPEAGDCWTGTMPTGGNESTSGHYAVDDDFGAPMLKRMEVDGWAIAARARAAAIRSFSSDLSATLLSAHDPTMQSMRAMVGRRKQGQLAFPTGQFAGMKVAPTFCRGGRFTVEKIWVALDDTGTVEISIRSTHPDFTTVAVTGATVTEAWTAIVPDAPIELDFWTPDGFAPDYYIMYEVNGRRHISQTVSCCGNTPECDANFRAGGVEGGDTLPETSSVSRTTNGLVLEGYTSCDFLGWLCDAPALAGYDTLDVAARTIQFLTGANIIREVLGLGVAGGPASFSAPEQVARMNWQTTRYTENVAWLGDNIPAKKVTDCLSCKESDRPRRAKLLV